MSTPPPTTPVGDDVPKVDGEVAVGENLAFQRKWWMFERLVWMFFVLVLVGDLAGLFGQGWLAKARMATPDGALTVDYDRIERASTPSTLVLSFRPAAVHGGKVQVYLSNSVVKALGAQTISPEPSVSALSADGLVYQFPAIGAPAEVQVQLQPSTVGMQGFSVVAAGEPPLHAKVFVLP